MKEIFSFLHLVFDIELAKKLAKKYPTEQKVPSIDWILPMVYIDPERVPNADLLKSVIFSSLPLEDSICNYLIDGNHTVTRAIKEGASLVNTVTLNVPETGLCGIFP